MIKKITNTKKPLINMNHQFNPKIVKIKNLLHEINKFQKQKQKS